MHRGDGSGVSVEDHRHGDRADREDSGGEQKADPEKEGHNGGIEMPGQDPDIPLDARRKQVELDRENQSRESHPGCGDQPEKEGEET